MKLKKQETIGYITSMLGQYGISKDVLLRYDEPHRYYHNIDHIVSMVDSSVEGKTVSEKLTLAIVFHDIIYDPKRSDNEEQSAELFYSLMPDNEIAEAIRETKDHNPKTKLGKQLCDLDLDILYRNDFQSFIDFEHKIFKEYQWVEYSIYKEKRIEILTNLGVSPEFINYIRYRSPKIGIYAGSFNPFHKGHLNILEKAEKIFDKVIIAKGKNPEKSGYVKNVLPEIVQNRQIIEYDSLLTDLIQSFDYPVTLIRGLRNENDFGYEKTQLRFMQDFYPETNVVNIICDKEFDHISSSAIRHLWNYPDAANKYQV